MGDFKYQKPFPIKKDTTPYKLLTKDYVSTVEVDGRKILKVDPKGLELLSKEAFSDVSFYLRPTHLQKLADILQDEESSDNDRFVAHTMLMNQVVTSEGELPTCQDTGTAIVVAKKVKMCTLVPTMLNIFQKVYLKPIVIETCASLKWYLTQCSKKRIQVLTCRLK